MGKLTLADAPVATDAELDEIADDAGVFATAQATTMPGWVAARKGALLAQVRKTRSELRRLEDSLARLEHLAAARFGGPMSEGAFAAEYAALEGWSLTLIANYIALAGLDGRYEKTQRFDRARNYMAGAIELAWSHQPSRALVFQKKVLEALGDQSLVFP